MAEESGIRRGARAPEAGKPPRAANIRQHPLSWHHAPSRRSQPLSGLERTKPSVATNASQLVRNPQESDVRETSKLPVPCGAGAPTDLRQETTSALTVIMECSCGRFCVEEGDELKPAPWMLESAFRSRVNEESTEKQPDSMALCLHLKSHFSEALRDPSKNVE